jgi:transcriptional regulator GlxA family with amidase domain
MVPHSARKVVENTQRRTVVHARAVPGGDECSRQSGKYALDIRLALAHRLLETTGLPVEAIAEAVGFNSQSGFSRLFRNHYGTGPSSFRRQ